MIRDVVTHIRGNFHVIAKNTESYIAVTVHVANTWVKFKFIDSYKFLSCSLKKLADYLPNDEKQLLFEHCETEEEFNLLCTKGFFPYE